MISNKERFCGTFLCKVIITVKTLIKMHEYEVYAQSFKHLICVDAQDVLF